jgi:hypothetical protein
LVIVPKIARPPLAYTPFVTTTSSPGVEASTASWIVAAAVAHELYGAAGVALFAST